MQNANRHKRTQIKIFVRQLLEVQQTFAQKRKRCRVCYKNQLISTKTPVMQYQLRNTKMCD